MTRHKLLTFLLPIMCFQLWKGHVLWVFCHLLFRAFFYFLPKTRIRCKWRFRWLLHSLESVTFKLGIWLDRPGYHCMQVQFVHMLSTQVLLGELLQYLVMRWEGIAAFRYLSAQNLFRLSWSFVNSQPVVCVLRGGGGSAEEFCDYILNYFKHCHGVWVPLRWLFHEVNNNVCIEQFHLKGRREVFLNWFFSVSFALSLRLGF